MIVHFIVCAHACDAHVTHACVDCSARVAVLSETASPRLGAGTDLDAKPKLFGSSIGMDFGRKT